MRTLCEPMGTLLKWLKTNGDVVKLVEITNYILILYR